MFYLADIYSSLYHQNVLTKKDYFYWKRYKESLQYSEIALSSLSSDLVMKNITREITKI